MMILDRKVDEDEKSWLDVMDEVETAYAELDSMLQEIQGETEVLTLYERGLLFMAKKLFAEASSDEEKYHKMEHHLHEHAQQVYETIHSETWESVAKTEKDLVSDLLG